jgi:hypothetical protein
MNFEFKPFMNDLYDQLMHNDPHNFSLDKVIDPELDLKSNTITFDYEGIGKVTLKVCLHNEGV